MLFIYTVKSGKSLGNNRGKKQSTLKVKDPLSLEICIFHNGQSDRDEDREMFVLIVST